MVADETDMTRVIENLSSNALRHAVRKIAFGVSEADEWVELSVTDDGPGVPQDKRQAVFERFSRLDSSRSRSYGGVGLGLAIVQEIVGRYGGTVRVEDGPGRGAGLSSACRRAHGSSPPENSKIPQRPPTAGGPAGNGG